MESEIILALRSVSIEALVIAGMVFALTMLIKWPIKRFTSKFDDNRRRAINTIIILIPAVLSFALAVLYLGIFKKNWLGDNTVELGLSVYFLSLTIYAIFSRIVVIVKGLKNGKSVQSSDIKENISAIKQDISQIEDSSERGDMVNKILSKIQELTTLKSSIEESGTSNSLVSMEEIDRKILELEEEKRLIENEKNKKGE